MRLEDADGAFCCPPCAVDPLAHRWRPFVPEHSGCRVEFSERAPGAVRGLLDVASHRHALRGGLVSTRSLRGRGRREVWHGPSPRSVAGAGAGQTEMPSPTLRSSSDRLNLTPWRRRRHTARCPRRRRAAGPSDAECRGPTGRPPRRWPRSPPPPRRGRTVTTISTAGRRAPSRDLLRRESRQAHRRVGGQQGGADVEEAVHAGDEPQ